jgi:hypothetical protein
VRDAEHHQAAAGEVIETLSQKQWRFLRYVGKLVAWAEREGYALTGAELFRSPEQAAIHATPGTSLEIAAGRIEDICPAIAREFRALAKRRVGVAGREMSIHRDRLAIDLNLFIDGRWQQDSAAYEPLGVYWESLGPDCIWGGRFSMPDGNHFSLRHDGRA